MCGLGIHHGDRHEFDFRSGCAHPDTHVKLWRLNLWHVQQLSAKPNVDKLTAAVSLTQLWQTKTVTIWQGGRWPPRSNQLDLLRRPASQHGAWRGRHLLECLECCRRRATFTASTPISVHMPKPPKKENLWNMYASPSFQVCPLTNFSFGTSGPM